MEGGNQISLALERVLLPYTRFPEADQPKLNIAVGFTSVEATLAALRRAGLLASSLGARITLHVPQLVPYPLPLERPPVLLDWNQRRFRVIAGASPVETVVRLYLCRDKVETLNRALSVGSLVVIGGPKVWWPFTREKRLAAALRLLGHEVIFIETETE